MTSMSDARVQWLRSFAIAALVSLGSNLPAAAADGFSDVSFTVSGSAGAWLLDFTVIPINPSNMENQSYIATFQIGVEGGTTLSQPAGYAATLIGGATAWQGNKNVVPTLEQSAPGGISGFESLVTTAAAPTAVSWSVVLASGSTLNDFYLNGAYQATVSDNGVALFAPAIPESGTFALMLLGLGAAAAFFAARRRAVRATP
jgi:hypothetical protein